jgi:PAS domain S-box-containing protein
VGDPPATAIEGRALDASTRRLVDTLDVPVVLVRRAGTIVHTNDAAVRCLGLPRSELRGRSLPDLTLDPDATRAQLDSWSKSTGPRPGTCTPRVGPRAGERLRCDGARVDDDLVVIRFSTGTDTDRLAQLTRDVEAASLRELQRRLRRAVAELEEANRQLAVRNAELDRYASAVAHDLRTPLYVVKGYADLLAAGAADVELGEDGRRLVDGVRSGAEKMGAVIEALLSVARFEVTPPSSAIDVGDVARSVVEEHRPALERADAAVEVDADVPGWIDPTHLGQILTNLLGNSVKFREADAPLRVRIQAVRDGDGVQVAVEDDGPGVPVTERERIFDLFERGSTSKERPGTGIGLATCRKIVESYGGTIRCDASPDLGGARFTFTIADPAPST